MSNVIVLAAPGTYAASLGWVLDAHALISELYESNETLGACSRVDLKLCVLTRDGGPAVLAGDHAFRSQGALAAVTDARIVYLPAFAAAQDLSGAREFPFRRPAEPAPPDNRHSRRPRWTPYPFPTQKR